MLFPEWAPEILQKKYGEITDRIASADDPEFVALFGSSAEDREKERKEADERREILLRLLTHPDMEKAWKALSRPVAPNKKAANADDIAWMLWYFIDLWLNEFDKHIAYNVTPAVKRDSLKEASRLAQKLIKVIDESPIISGLSSAIPSLYLTETNLEMRAKEGESLHWTESSAGWRLSLDWREGAGQCDYEDENCPWEELPLTERLVYWAKQANEMRLIDLLSTFVEVLERESEVPPKIKQPSRADQALRSFLVIRLDEFMHYYFAQPLSETVAHLITVILDLNVPLSRDDVRPVLSRQRREQS